MSRLQILESLVGSLEQSLKRELRRHMALHQHRMMWGRTAPWPSERTGLRWHFLSPGHAWRIMGMEGESPTPKKNLLDQVGYCPQKFAMGKGPNKKTQ